MVLERHNVRCVYCGISIVVTVEAGRLSEVRAPKHTERGKPRDGPPCPGSGLPVEVIDPAE